MNIKNKRLEFLTEGVEYYSVNPSERRNTNEIGGCYYAPIHSKTEGCFIGRKLPLDIAQKLDAEIGKTIKDEPDLEEYFSGYINEDFGISCLTSELLELGADFLGACQKLHDDTDNWTPIGLSDEGKEYVEHIKNEYC